MRTTLKHLASLSLTANGNIIDIIEKPDNPPSSIAIGGIYLYDEQFWNLVDECQTERMVIRSQFQM